MSRTAYHPSDFERGRRWPVGLIALLIFMCALSDLVCLWAGTRLGYAIAAEEARVEAAKPKRTAARALPPFITDCSKRALQEIRTACYLRAQSELTRPTQRTP